MAQLVGGLLVGFVVGALVFGWRARRTRSGRLVEVERGLQQATADLAEAEQEGARREVAQDLMLEAMEEGVLLLDPQGARVYANRAFADLLGASPDRALDL